MDIEKDIHIPAELMLVGIQHFPFKHRNVLNFFIQGAVVFLVAAILGYEAGHYLVFVCK